MSAKPDLAEAKRVFLDTAALIYFGEQHPKYSAIAKSILAQAIENKVELAIGPITVAECFAGIDDSELVGTMASLLFESGEIIFYALSRNAAVSAGRLRRQLGLPLADALQVAQAIDLNCDLIVSNDADLSTRQAEIPVLLLSDYINGKS